ncbi:SRPBCC family protein [Streptomyces sp. DSM 44917]|uniref:SRPBCC family protein n=1 Tax=Streptomyces boetiae TaxID=3075541 RepID=A0ABU2L4N2_9ACTN|nr:SRPBCC family protein [Streptomyces sp. DSM 44917]MDT0306495.1 SRPBCC family protein [Streptomyces sp. DSM 44917]
MTTTASSSSSAPPRVTIDTSRAFTHRCVRSAVIPASREAIYGALFDMRAWQDLLPHVQRIEVLHDDGQYQEFMMTVKSDTDGQPLTVRSIRNCREDIEFFQPVPPRFLRHHGGIWRFHPQGPGETLVEVTHVWNLLPEVAAEVYPPGPEGSTEDQVERMLGNHSQLTLQGWQRVFSGGGR